MRSGFGALWNSGQCDTLTWQWSVIGRRSGKFALAAAAADAYTYAGRENIKFDLLIPIIPQN